MASAGEPKEKQSQKKTKEEMESPGKRKDGPPPNSDGIYNQDAKQSQSIIPVAIGSICRLSYNPRRTRPPQGAEAVFHATTSGIIC